MIAVSVAVVVDPSTTQLTYIRSQHPELAVLPCPYGAQISIARAANRLYLTVFGLTVS